MNKRAMGDEVSLSILSFTFTYFSLLAGAGDAYGRREPLVHCDSAFRAKKGARLTRVI